MAGDLDEGSKFVPRSPLLAAAAIAVLLFSLLLLSHALGLSLSGLFCGSSGSILSSGTLTAFISDYGYLSLFLLMTAESASVPIPSEIVLPLTGFFVSEGVLGSLPLALAVSTVGALVGAMIDYVLARQLGRPFVARALLKVRVSQAGLDRAEAWFARSGQWTVFAARFVPLVRTLVSFPAGLFRMRLGTFLLMTLAGCVLWNAILLYAGYAAGQYLGTCSGAGSWIVTDGFSLVLAGTAVVYLAYFAAGARAGAARTVSRTASAA